MRRWLLWAAAIGSVTVVVRLPRIIALLRTDSVANIVTAAAAAAVPVTALLAARWTAPPAAFRPESVAGRIVRNRRIGVGAGVVCALLLAAVFAPVLTGYDPAAQLDLLGAARLPPSLAHPFGTDRFSRDVLSRVLYGARYSLSIAMLSVVAIVLLGTAVGLAAGFGGAGVDTALMRLVDTGLAIPRVFLLIVIVALWDTVSPWALVTVLGLTGWFATSRLVRAEVLSLRQRDYVVAARAAGVEGWRLVRRHVLPNIASPILVTAALGVGNIILIEAGLSYLGIGVRPPTPSWGNLIRDGRDLLATAPWISTLPGLAIVITVLGFSLLGDGLRDAIDPRSR